MEQKTGPRDIFLHLLSIIALYISVGSFIALIFQYINFWMPDPLQEGYYYITSLFNSVRWSISVLIVVFPVYGWTIWYLNKGYREVPERMQLRSRRWLIYLTIFLAALLMIGDLVALVYNLLRGEFTTRFLLKILTVLLTSGAVFSYYLWESKGQPDGSLRAKIKSLSLAVTAIIAAAIIGGFFMVGSPQTEREYQFDEQKLGNLQMIQGQIVEYWRAKERIPDNLRELEANDINGFRVPLDPQTGQEYVYKKTGNLSFELCADFNRADRSASVANPKFVGEPYLREQNWQHEAGETCFQRTIDPDFIPTLDKTRI